MPFEPAREQQVNAIRVRVKLNHFGAGKDGGMIKRSALNFSFCSDPIYFHQNRSKGMRTMIYFHSDRFYSSISSWLAFVVGEGVPWLEPFNGCPLFLYFSCYGD